MAISVVRSAEAENVGVNNLTFAFDATGCDALFVGACNSDSLDTCDTGTFNGVSMTRLFTREVELADQGWCTGFFLASPAQGSYNVVITWSDLTSTLWACAVGLSGAASYRTVYTAYQNATPATVTVVDSVSGDLVIDCIHVYDATTLTAGGSQTELQRGGNASRIYAVSTQPATGGNTVMSWPPDDSDYYAQGAVALVPSASDPITWIEHSHRTVIFG